MEKLTANARRALKIISGIPDPNIGMTAKGFAYAYYKDTKHEYLLSACSNQGHGACRGKKAWLCAGSYLKKLCKKGLVRENWTRDGQSRYRITPKGRETLKTS